MTDTRTRTITWTDPGEVLERARGMNPLEFLEATARGDLPPPPIAQLMGFRLVEVARGRVVFEGVPAEYHFNPIGSVHGGFAAALCDSALGCAVHTTLSAEQGYATTDLSVRMLRRIGADTGPLRCEGLAVHTGRTHAVAEARLTDAQGRLYAHATTGCAVFPLRA